MTDHPDLTLRVADMADASSLAALSMEVWEPGYPWEPTPMWQAKHACATETGTEIPW